MAVTTTLSITNVFEDETKSTININKIDVTKLSVENIRSKLKAFNADPTELASLMKSKYGFDWKGVSAAKITTKDRNYIF